MPEPEALVLSVFINRPPGAVYDFASDPANLPRWAGGLCKAVRKAPDGRWIIDTPEGEVGLRFTPWNEYRVLDHTVILAPGVEVDVPMRVVSRDSGSFVLFTLFRLPGMDDEGFKRDAAMVRHDLEQLKRVVEALAASEAV